MKQCDPLAGITVIPLNMSSCIFSVRMRSLLKYGISSSRHFIHSGRDSSHRDDETIDGLQVVLDLNTSDYAYAEM